MAPEPTRRILVIEDDDAIRRGVVDMLDIEGYAPLEAGHGTEGLRMAEQVDIDLVLLDLMLPKVDGATILERLRPKRSTPVLVLTAALAGLPAAGRAAKIEPAAALRSE